MTGVIAPPISVGGGVVRAASCEAKRLGINIARQVSRK